MTIRTVSYFNPKTKTRKLTIKCFPKAILIQQSSNADLFGRRYPEIRAGIAQF